MMAILLYNPMRDPSVNHNHRNNQRQNKDKGKKNIHHLCFSKCVCDHDQIMGKRLCHICCNNASFLNTNFILNFRNEKNISFPKLSGQYRRNKQRYIRFLIGRPHRYINM